MKRRGSRRDFCVFGMRAGKLSCGPKKELKAFGVIFHWQQVWKERAYLKASVVGLVLGSQSWGVRPSPLAQRSQQPPESGQFISRGNPKCWVYCMKTTNGWVVFHHRQISRSCSGLNKGCQRYPRQAIWRLNLQRPQETDTIRTEVALGLPVIYAV